MTQVTSLLSVMADGSVSRRVWKPAMLLRERRRRRESATSGASFADLARTDLCDGRHQRRAAERGSSSQGVPKVVVVVPEEVQIPLEGGHVLRADRLVRSNLKDVACEVARSRSAERRAA